MRRFCYILFVALAVAGFACKSESKSNFNMQKELASLGVSASKIALNPSMLTPFLDDSNPEEATLKKFLRCVNEVNIFSFPNRQVLDDIALRVEKAGYRQRVDLWQKPHRMWVYALPSADEQIIGLVVLLQESDKVFYGIDMKGHIDSRTFAEMGRVSPSFFENYIRRFNVKF